MIFRFVGRFVGTIVIGLSLFLSSTFNSHALSGLKNAFQSNFCMAPEIPEPVLEELKAVYEKRQLVPVWITENSAPNQQSQILLAELQRSAAHGLQSRYYNLEALLALVNRGDAKSLQCFELALSASFMRYANDITNGHIRKETTPEHILVEPVLHNTEQLLSEADDAGGFQEFFKTLLTTDDRYVRLISKLAEFLRIDARNAWPEIRNLGSSDNPASDPEKVRELLLFTGDLQSSDLLRAESGSTILKQAIARYQARHGLQPTQRVDLATIRQMGVPVAEKIRQIRINLERRRWQNRDLGPDHIYVNVADRSVRIVRKGEKTGSLRLSSLDGLDSLPTFSGQMTGVELNEQGQLAFVVESDVSVTLFGGKLKSRLVVEGDAQKNVKLLLGTEASEAVLENPVDVIKLAKPLNAFVTYVTAWANKDGSISFRPDVFKRDRELAELLNFSN